MLGTVGTDPMGGAQRLTLGLLELSDGIPFVLLVMATFALAEAFRLALGESQAPQGAFSMRDLLIPMSLFRRLTRVAGRSSVLGFVIGVMPGAGATLASFFAYDLEKRVGDGSREAGVAPEAATTTLPRRVLLCPCSASGCQGQVPLRCYWASCWPTACSRVPIW